MRWYFRGLGVGFWGVGGAIWVKIGKGCINYGSIWWNCINYDLIWWICIDYDSIWFTSIHIFIYT